MRVLFVFFGFFSNFGAFSADICQFGNLNQIFKMDAGDYTEGLRSKEAFEEKAIFSVQDPIDADDTVVKLKITPEYVVHNGNRTELTVSDYHEGAYVFHYSFKFMLPNSYVSDGDWQIFAQWHDQPDVAEGETWSTLPRRPPPVSLLYNEDVVYINFRPQPRKVIQSNKVKVKRDLWHSVSFKIRWAEDSLGEIQVKLDGEPFVGPKGSEIFSGPNMYNKAGNYFKFGIYRGPGAEHSNTIYFKDLEIHSECIKGKS
ncbi:heparin lyase I family protein [Rheinheimera sp.]|uniref:heparin lyase I family protein n=1 Tax=Rheinheimera sp. TaxID=1869214 RepID=UPI0027340B84|nr:heparin lyase I family protein [Rheinheimera sp.]MDP2715750.1 heparin lyase I family protein [Rheinheimera sp.]